MTEEVAGMTKRERKHLRVVHIILGGILITLGFWLPGPLLVKLIYWVFGVVLVVTRLFFPDLI